MAIYRILAFFLIFMAGCAADPCNMYMRPEIIAGVKCNQFFHKIDGMYVSHGCSCEEPLPGNWAETLDERGICGH